MMKFNRASSSVPEKHLCDSTRDGDWIIYTCPLCNYELRENWRDGQIIVRNAKVNVNHSGRYMPAEYQDAYTNLN